MSGPSTHSGQAVREALTVVAFAFFLLANGLLAVGLFRLARNAKARAEFVEDIIRKPLEFLFLVVFQGSALIAGWGIVSLGRLSWPISTPWGVIQSWALGGLVALACLVGGFFVACARELLHDR